MNYKCWYCRCYEDGKLCCSSCEQKLKEGKICNRSNVYIKETIILSDGLRTSRAQISEVERRVVLNDNGQTYDVGRRGENGKIQEREPNYA